MVAFGGIGVLCAIFGRALEWCGGMAGLGLFLLWLVVAYPVSLGYLGDGKRAPRPPTEVPGTPGPPPPAPAPGPAPAAPKAVVETVVESKTTKKVTTS